MPDLDDLNPDCGHECCPERQNPYHGHFRGPDVCPLCERQRERVENAVGAIKGVLEQIQQVRHG